MKKTDIMNKLLSILAMIFLSQFGMRVYAQSLIVVVQKETSMYNQTWFYSVKGNSLQEENIKKYWNEDFYINSVAYTSKGWFVTMAKGLKWTNQAYSYRSSWPDDWVHEQMNAGYMITSLSSSGSNWMVVMSKNTDYSTQEICSAPWSTLKEWIQKWWDKDYYITSLTCRDGMWTVVMSKTSLYTDQSYMFGSTISEIKEKIKKKWDEGFRITAFEYEEAPIYALCVNLLKALHLHKVIR